MGVDFLDESMLRPQAQTYTSTSTNNNNHNDNQFTETVEVNTSMDQIYSLVRRETKIVNLFRVVVMGLLLFTAALFSTGVYMYTRNEENQKFISDFQDSSSRVIESFHETVERKLGAIAMLSSVVTAFANNQNNSTKTTSPFVTVPNFEVLGSHIRVLSGSHGINYMPLITDERRKEWEEYSLEHRFQIDEAFERDAVLRARQDAEYSFLNHGENNNQGNRRQLMQDQIQRHPQQEQKSEKQRRQQQGSTNPNTILKDGTGYHPRIWNNGAVGDPVGDELDGKGPFFPAWQRSPINHQKQKILNVNVARVSSHGEGLYAVARDGKAVITGADYLDSELLKEALKQNLELSQYRGSNIDALVQGLSTILFYPVFDSFSVPEVVEEGNSPENRKVVGALTTNIYWDILLSNLLPESSRGIICLIENSFNQSFAYRIDGPRATFLLDYYKTNDNKIDIDARNAMIHHDEDLEATANVNEYLQTNSNPKNRAYSAVGLDENYGKYTIRVYPSKDMKAEYITAKPLIYTFVVVCCFFLASTFFLLFIFVVERRHHTMMQTTMEYAKKVTQTERDINEFLAHEIRNPLAAAMSACNFVSTTINDPDTAVDDKETLQLLCEDLEVIDTSLQFVNDFLRGMLDIHRATSKKLILSLKPTDILLDVLEPVSSMLYRRDDAFDIIVDCPQHLVILTDRLRLKQVVLNLVRNACKFVERGYIRIRAEITDNTHQVKLYVEDTGPGIPVEKRKTIFSKYQESLDSLSQGAGLGLCLSKNLMASMNGDLYHDEKYVSDIQGSPGARFVVELNCSPINLEAIIEVPVTSRSGRSRLGKNNRENVVNHGKQYDSLRKKDDDNNIHGIPTSELDINANSKSNRAIDEKNPAATTSSKDNIASTTPSSSSFNSSPEVSNNIFATTTNDNTLVAHNKTNNIPQPALASSLPENLSVLFVDDDIVLRKLFMRAARKVGGPKWKILEAASGESAIKLCDSETFDIIFIDQYMVSVDKQLLGSETVVALRNNGVTCRLCGLSANDIAEAFMKAGADYFVMKPMPCKPIELQRLFLKVLYEDYDTLSLSNP